MSAQLEEMGLLREYQGRWQYKFDTGPNWYTSDDKAGAVEMAQKLFDSLPGCERLTVAQRNAMREAVREAESEAMWGKKSDAELFAELGKLETKLASLHKVARREMSSNGYRRTAPAVAAEGARDVGAIKMRLTGYMRRRGVAL